MSTAAIRTIKLPSGEAIPVLGQGTWGMAEDARHREDEIVALRLGLDLGMSLIDTAEMYAAGATEELVGEAIAGRRDDVFLVSKVLPDREADENIAFRCAPFFKALEEQARSKAKPLMIASSKNSNR
jgi:diketogulonate reductase-like aldo/keto reductase